MNILELLGKSDNHGERSDILNISGANILPPSDKQSNDNDVISSVDKSLEDNINEVLNISVNPDIKVSENIPETLKNTENRTRVMFCGTYPIGQSNGYSRVVYNTAKHLGLYDDIKLTIYGFQNFKQVKSTSRNDIPNSVVP